MRSLPGHLIVSVVLACIGLTIQLLLDIWLLLCRQPWWAAQGYQSVPSFDGYNDADVQAPKNIYFDCDGQATEASTREVQDLPQRLLLLISSTALVGMAAAVNFYPNNFLRFLDSFLLVLLFIGWCAVVVHAFTLARISKPFLRYILGFGVATTSLLLLAAFLVQLFTILALRDFDIFSKFACLAHIALALTNAVTALSFHRRPDVFRDGRLVDEQLSTTAISRLYFSWASRLIRLGHSKSSLDEKDLPLLDLGFKSEDLKNSIESRPEAANQPLWILLLREHGSIMALQWTLAFFEALSMFGPEFAMFRLLNILERRQLSHDILPMETWPWVTLLGLTSILHITFEEWVDWTKWSCLELRVSAQLNAIIYSKALRVQDIKDTTDPAATNEQITGHPLTRQSTSDEQSPLLLTKARCSSTLVSQRDYGEVLLPEGDHSDADASSEDESDDGSGTRGVVNLMDVDTERISVNCTELSEILSNLIKLAIGLSLLVSILGWPSTFAGASIPLVFAPITKWVTSSYTTVSEKVSKARDRKTNVVNEALNGMRQIKFGALEKRWQQSIMAARGHELSLLRKLMYWSIALATTFMTMPVVLGVTALSVYSLTRGKLSASVAFTALSVFSGLESSLSYLPILFADLADTIVSMRRIAEFMGQPDKEDYVRHGEAIIMKDATISWPTKRNDSSAFSLCDVNLRFPPGSLSVILGKTGCGKSLLLAGVIGEAQLISGHVFAPQPPSEHGVWELSSMDESNWEVSSMKAFVSQIPWIENMSLKDNILYGLPFNASRYRSVIHACALEQDLSILQDGDETEIGASGINLSGGQKWRLTLARALYSRAGILILDDIFSAVDSHVGRHILDHAILGDLGRKRIILLATHHADLVVPVAQYVVEIIGSHQIRTTEHFDRPRSPSINQTFLQPPKETPEQAETAGICMPRKFVEAENQAEGHIALQVYKAYFRASGGWLFWLVVLFTFIVSGVITLARSYWIKSWTEANAEDVSNYNGQSHHSIGLFLGVYAALSVGYVISSGIKLTVVRFGMLRAGRLLFEQVTKSVLKGNLQWIDTVPVGRALNRFIGDFATVDSAVATWVAYSFHEVFLLLTILVSALIVSPYTIMIIVPLLLAIAIVTWRYLRPARDLKRIHSISESRILDLIGVSLSGLDTIRTFDKASVYMSRMCDLLDKKCRANYHINLVSSWMESRHGLLSSLFEISIAVFVVMDPNISAATAGFALSFALDFSGQIIELVMDYTRLELDMNAVERIIEYAEIPGEKQEGDKAPASWPSEGRVEVRDLKVTYATDLPPVLKGLTFSIEPHERVGVVGRTGSGKSSLILALFRFLDPLEGSIHIDGIDINTIKLQQLRSRLSIIPQDPILFAGTIRSNLDPFHKFTDAKLLAALRQINLLDARGIAVDETQNKNMFLDLQSPISKAGLNLSQGQRQLMCLARALLTEPRVMLLDEATSAVDMDTDTIIQRSVREGFDTSTLIVIAHRLSTIIDFNKILVLGDGKVLEFGPPLEIYRQRGVFAEMVNQSGEREKLIAAIGANGSSALDNSP